MIVHTKPILGYPEISALIERGAVLKMGHHWHLTHYTTDKPVDLGDEIILDGLPFLVNSITDDGITGSETTLILQKGPETCARGWHEWQRCTSIHDEFEWQICRFCGKSQQTTERVDERERQDAIAKMFVLRAALSARD